MKPSDIIARDAEWSALTDFYDREGGALGLVLGRRRSGKSYLLTRFAAAVGGVYYQATRQTEREQLLGLSRVLAERYDDAALRRATVNEWDDLLDYVVERAGAEPLLLVIDEFPYVSDAAPALPSILQRWLDHRLGGSRVRLILCGSHVSAMRRLVGPDQPLFGRRDLLLEVAPFGYREVAGFTPGWTETDRLLAYAMFGGLPGHLALIDPADSLRDNVARHLLAPTGRLHEEAAHAFDAFLGESAVHYAVVEAIAAGNRKWSRIASRVGKQTSALQRPLDWLLRMGVVRRELPFRRSGRDNPKLAEYVLDDPYLGFWYRFVAPLRARGVSALLSPGEVYDAYIATEALVRDHAAFVYEAACRQFVGQHGAERLGFRAVQVGRWWDGREEADVVALDLDDRLLVGECKWGRFDERYVEVLVARGERVAGGMGSVAEVMCVAFVRGEVVVSAEAAAVARGVRVVRSLEG